MNFENEVSHVWLKAKSSESQKLTPLKVKNDLTHEIQLKLHECDCNVIWSKNIDEINLNYEKTNNSPSYLLAMLINWLTMNKLLSNNRIGNLIQVLHFGQNFVYGCEKSDKGKIQDLGDDFESN